ncbi:MAG TPA: YqaJ viral recombinase family protein [Aeromicrobium sp.]|nr:YqaJ viral recombinase family protein [Aeromicrobium sp.]HKY59248.1 YqaJ viral recombinase family protein [Aeromicrobium sp.]
MTLRILDNLEQGSPEWHDQRRGMVTASVVGNLLSVGKLGAIGYGCSKCSALANDPCVSLRDGKPIKTLHPERAATAEANRASAPLVIEVANNETSRGLTKLLVAERITGWTDPTFTSDDMWRGIEDEPRAREMYAKHHAPVEEVGFMVRQEDGWTLGYSPDGLVGDDGLIEVKSRRAKNHLATVLADKVPAENMAQAQAGLLVSGRKWLDYISFAGGMAFWSKRVFPDPIWFKAIEEACRTFEHAAESMANTYLERVDGLPKAERIVEMEMTLR